MLLCRRETRFTEKYIRDKEQRERYVILLPGKVEVLEEALNFSIS